MTTSGSRPLTPRQRAFIKAWIENGGNGTRAAMTAYGCNTANAAAVCASRLLRKAKLRQAIQAELPLKSLDNKTIVRVIANATRATKSMHGVDVPDHPTRLRAADMILRLWGAYGRQ